MDNLCGQSLDKIINSLSLSQRHRLKDSIKSTIRLLHEKAGVCHRDIRAKNIMIADGEAVMFDFSHAYFKTRMSQRSWEVRVQADYIMLDYIFAEVETYHVRPVLTDFRPDH